MTATRPITIVGGGLAGLTLGIALRQRNVPVALWEAGHYPRHRVCGEFISGRGQASLVRLGLYDVIKQAGAIMARTVRFCTPAKAGRIRTLAQPALCLPRDKMDAMLAGNFRDLGGELREGRRWGGAPDSEGVVLATGRRLQTVADGWRWFGLKTHVTGLALDADLEMHVSSRGYVGLCRQPGGIVNVCGLFRGKSTPAELAKGGRELLCGAPGSLLHEQMSRATFVPDSFCAVAGINLKPQRAQLQGECRIGDALTMIPPMTGNGMSIAFESAELAVEPLVGWGRGEQAWGSTRQDVARQCDELLAVRLRWAAALQHLFMFPMLQGRLLAFVSRSDWLWRTMFSKTR